MQPEVSILQPILDERNIKRRKLLPLWIKIFIWFFMIAGAFTPIILLFSLLLPGANVQLALFGFETNNALTATGIFIAMLFLLKGIVSFGLWTEKRWAIDLAIADAILSIVICAFSMLVIPIINTGTGFTVRLELILLIPYLIKLNRIKPEWKISNHQS